MVRRLGWAGGFAWAVLALGSVASASAAEAGSAPVSQPADPSPAPGPAPAPVDPNVPSPAVMPQPTDAPAADVPAVPSPAEMAAATATPPPAVAAPAGPPPMPFPLQLTFMSYHYIGEGTFAWNRYARNPMLSSWFSLRGRVRLPYNFAVSLRQDVDFEYTKTDLNTYDKQAQLGDTRIGISYGGLRLPELGLGFSLWTGTRVPLSLESRYRRQFGTADLVGGVDWSKWGIIASAAFIATLSFRQPGKPNIRDNFFDGWFNDGNNADGFVDGSGRYMSAQKCIARASELAAGGCPATGAMNGNMGSLIAFLTVGYDLSAMLHIPVSFTATLATIHAFSNYFGPNDQYRSPYGKVGINRTDLTWGLIQASWQATDWLSLDVGTSSVQPLMNASNQYVRLPFWNIPYWDLGKLGNYTGANNFSSLMLGITTTAPW